MVGGLFFPNIGKIKCSGIGVGQAARGFCYLVLYDSRD